MKTNDNAQNSEQKHRNHSKNRWSLLYILKNDPVEVTLAVGLLALLVLLIYITTKI